jgi:hypothetical protein
MQQDLVEVVPFSPNRLLQDGSLQVGNVDAAFDTGRLLQQRRLIDDAGGRIRRTIRAELLGHRWCCCDKDQQCRADKEKPNARKSRHDTQPSV